MENNMFDFRIIAIPDGTEVIDRSLKTPYNALTRSKMLDYIEVEAQLAFADRQRRRAQRARKKMQIKKEVFHRLACLCGLV